VATIAERLKRVVLGRALASHKAEHQLLPKTLALPVFSSDPLSSNAYATEEMMLVLVLAGAAGLSLMLPIAAVIVMVLLIVVTSYRQTVRAYPRGGGSYIVARENLGTVPGLTAAAAILIGYVVTAAVSVTAGSVAVTSAWPGLAPYRVPLALGFIALIAIANLRGVRESGLLFAVPTYGFVACVYLILVTGVVRCLGGCPEAPTANEPLPGLEGVTLLLVLRALTQGSSALTGVEAIADGVQAFRKPQGKNAAATLAVMAAMTVTMFVGITVMARVLDVRVTHEIAATRSVLSQVAETVFGRGGLFFVVQAFTTMILIVAANTAYQDFPRLSAILARDRFVPRQFMNRGDRLVFSNGVLLLSVLAGLMVWAFDGRLTGLIPLYLVSVFTAFTLSQSGMVRRWMKTKEEGWRRNAVINGIGAFSTGLVLTVGVVTRFLEGAWTVIVAIPIIVVALLRVRRHYDHVHSLLRSRGLSADMEPENHVVLIVSDVDLATREAVSWLHTVRARQVIPLYVGRQPIDVVQARWREMAPGSRFGDLHDLQAREEHVFRAVRNYVRGIDRRPDDFVTVVVPERLQGRSLLAALVPRQGSRFLLKAGLLFEPGVVVVDIPLLPEAEPDATERAARAERSLELERNVCIVPVSGVHDATVRALAYAESLQPAELEAVFLVQDPGEEEDIVRGWSDPERHIDVPLTLLEAPFRDFGPPFLEEVRKHTARGDTVVTVVLPEFIMRPLWRQFLFHNQTALFFKRLLLFEPEVVVVSVPIHFE
jgi:amino acid transporter